MNKDVRNYTLDTVGAILTYIQTERTFQIVSLILTILATLVSITYTLWRWYKNAKKDGKIDAEEIKEGVDIVSKGINEIKNQIDKDKENKQ